MDAFAQAVSAGADPITTRCAIHNDTTSPVCVIATYNKSLVTLPVSK
jgi:hypothetical protein